MKQGESLHIKAGQDNSERKDFQEQAKESEIYPFSLLGLSDEHQGKSRNIHLEDLG